MVFGITGRSQLRSNTHMKGKKYVDLVIICEGEREFSFMFGIKKLSIFMHALKVSQSIFKVGLRQIR